MELLPFTNAEALFRLLAAELQTTCLVVVLFSLVVIGGFIDKIVSCLNVSQAENQRLRHE